MPSLNSKKPVSQSRRGGWPGGLLGPELCLRPRSCLNPPTFLAAEARAGPVGLAGGL